MRWLHPTFGLISPEELIAIAERTGFILPIGEWVIDVACEQFSRWQSEGRVSPACRLAINISSCQLVQDKFPRVVADTLSKHGISAHSVVLEVTEASITTYLVQSENVLRELRNLGVTIAIDDYGIGYSTLSRIRGLPVKTLKIDRSFIKDVLVNKNNAIIVESIIAVAKSLGLDVVAEGIETEEQRQFLIDHGCHEMQGYYLSKPLTSADMSEFLKKKPINAQH